MSRYILLLSCWTQSDLEEDGSGGWDESTVSWEQCTALGRGGVFIGGSHVLFLKQEARQFCFSKTQTCSSQPTASLPFISTEFLNPSLPVMLDLIAFAKLHLQTRPLLDGQAGGERNLSGSGNVQVGQLHEASWGRSIREVQDGLGVSFRNHTIM
ncbi:hypothetical protein BDK51DRAFT_30407 [Blyttiomyces helicus]|uniref:Uncharacterized protein n=1 Tax=Blyttiomyces helicus TaxID=388810 RepID=A0A4P9WHQ5_9FUNG|nr:hypothetical protein BDK51DRAFT_30407 [Blyttiomyces helicus]|eukprot:RKO91373.1 hypothetical protein BDK51DRAFT_30407 [Blyttiomyces helicus]